VKSGLRGFRVTLLHKVYGARGRTRTGTRVKSRGILSPLCLPISPPGQTGGGRGRNRTGVQGFAGLCITILLLDLNVWSGKRGSNSRPQPWQGCALPLSYSRITRIYITLFYKIVNTDVLNFS
jgi:hypothetical protein